MLIKKDYVLKMTLVWERQNNNHLVILGEFWGKGDMALKFLKLIFGNLSYIIFFRNEWISWILTYFFNLTERFSGNKGQSHVCY